MKIDTTNMCLHLQKKLFEPDGVYYPIWQAMKDDESLTAMVRSRQLTSTGMGIKSSFWQARHNRR